MERSMSDPTMESKEELKKAVEAVKRKQSENSGEMSPISPTSLSFGEVFSDEVKIVKADSSAVESQPDGWTVVDVNLDTSPKQKPLEFTSEVTKPPLSPKPKPALPTKPKPKLPVPDRGNAEGSAGINFTSTVTTKPEEAKSNKTEQPKKIETVTSSDVESVKRFSDYAEIESSVPETKNVPSTSPSGNVKGKLSLFEGGGPVKPPVYAKPDMSKKKVGTKSPTSNNDTVPAALENSKEEKSAEPPPLLPSRHYTKEDLDPLKPTARPLPAPPPVRNNSPENSPKGNGFRSLEANSSAQSLQKDMDSDYEVVEPRNVKPSSVAQQQKAVPSPPPHNKRIENRKDMPPAPPSPFKDRVPPPPVRGSSLAGASPPSPSKKKVEPDYSEVAQARNSPTLQRESLYSEVEDTRKTAEVQAYFTTDVVRGLPSKGGMKAKREPPPKPAPYKSKKTTEGEPHPPSSSEMKYAVSPAPPLPAPYRPNSVRSDFSNTAVSSGGDQVQSPVTPGSPHVPVLVPGSPRLHSAKLVSDSSPSSTSSFPVLNRSPPKFKPPPPPRVSSVTDVTKEETLQAPEPEVSPYLPVNGISEHEDVDEIPTRDFSVVLGSPKPFLPPKPQLGSKPNHINEEHGPPSFKPPPPPKFSSLAPRAYGATSGSFTADRERAGSQYGTDSFGVIAPPPLDWMDSKDERSTSITSVDSLDLKIVPPPPMHFKDLDPVNLTFEIQDIKPLSDWQEGMDRKGNVKTPTGGPRKTEGTLDYISLVPPPPPPSIPPPTLPMNGPVDVELDLVPSLLSGGPGGLNREDILGDLDNSLSLPSNRYDGASDDEDFLPPAPLPPGERYPIVPPPPGDAVIKPLVPPLRKQR